MERSLWEPERLNCGAIGRDSQDLNSFEQALTSKLDSELSTPIFLSESLFTKNPTPISSKST
jgi:hypothetical protein